MLNKNIKVKIQMWEIKIQIMQNIEFSNDIYIFTTLMQALYPTKNILN